MNSFRQEVFLDNKIRLINGDCLDIMDNLIQQGVTVDAIITDPPYGTTSCKWDTAIPFDEMWGRLNRLVKQEGVVALFGSESFSSYLRISNINNYKYDWVWEKSKATGYLNAKKRPLVKHELIHIFYSKPPVYNPQGLIEKEKITISKGDRGKKGIGSGGEVYGKATKDAIQTHTNYPLSIIKFQVETKVVHPTQKPVALIEYLIKTYTNENDLVLDFTSGSFTTGIACINTNRNFIGIELDENYFQIGVERVKNKLQII